MVFYRRYAAGFVIWLLMAFPALPAAAQLLTGYGETPQIPAASRSAPAGRAAPVEFQADTLEHDETGQIITATGHVELAQEGRVLKADRIVYNLQTDTVTATGHVALMEPTGDVHFADEVQLTQKMKDGFVAGLQSYLADGGHFIAKNGQKNGNTIVMSDAAYTPCECGADEEGDPAWQIKADTVTYDQDAHKISYENARFEIFGVPLAWLPFLSHSDGKVKRKSGLLSPQVGFNSELGMVVTSNYYWALAPDYDLTTGVMAMTAEAPVALAEYRQRFDQADMKINGSLTRSGRTDDINGLDEKKKDSWRGHLFADSRWHINEKWRAGSSLELTSDDQYLRQYDFSNKNVLENEVYAERFSGRNYLVTRALAFQDVRAQEERTDQPNILPEMNASFVGEPNAALGGRWALDLSMLSLQRYGSGQDMQRGVARVEWEKRVVTDFGLVNTIEASARGDAYLVGDSDQATPGSGQSRHDAQTRLFPQVHVVSSYPLVKPLEKAQAVIEPVAALTAAPNIGSEYSDFPNEDSQDLQLDASNIFEASRFPGIDRFEDGVRATYGIRTGLYGYDGSHADIFLGQSYRFNNDESLFPSGSGLSDQQSDMVGQISASYQDHFSLNYRFQLGSDTLVSRRHELDAYTEWGRFMWGTRYLFAKGLEGTDITESREQIDNGIAYRVTQNWRLRGSARHDLGEDPGLRKAAVGIDYLGCCVYFSANAERDLTDDSSGGSGTDITFRVGLKGLGEFQSGGGDWDKDWGDGR